MFGVPVFRVSSRVKSSGSASGRITRKVLFSEASSTFCPSSSTICMLPFTNSSWLAGKRPTGSSVKSVANQTVVPGTKS